MVAAFYQLDRLFVCLPNNKKKALPQLSQFKLKFGTVAKCRQLDKEMG